MSDSTRASLTGLPRELRLIIYDYVCDLRPDCNPSKRFTNKFTARPQADNETGTDTPVTPQAATPFHLPWRNLLLTCRTTAMELKAIMTQSPFLNIDNNRTYVLDMQMGSNRSRPDSFTWRNIPCAPQDADYLVVNIIAGGGEIHTRQASGRLRFQDCFMDSAYHTLNYFMHCGPKMDRNTPLKDHLSLKRLLVVFHDVPYVWDEAHCLPLTGTDTEGFCEEAISDMGWAIENLFAVDYFAPYFKAIRLQYGEDHVEYIMRGERLPASSRPFCYSFAKISVDLQSKWACRFMGLRWGGMQTRKGFGSRIAEAVKKRLGLQRPRI